MIHHKQFKIKHSFSKGLNQILKHNNSKDDGFTIIESLVGMLVASLLVASIAPMILLSTATRLQSRRVEQGSQAAKSFIDAVRSGRIAVQSSDSTDEYIKTINAEFKKYDPSDENTKRSLEKNPGDYLINDTDDKEMPAPQDATGLYCFQTDGFIRTPFNCANDSNNQKDQFYIQASRIIVENSGPEDGYRLAVRVYRKDVDFDQTVVASVASIEPSKKTQTIVTNGLGNKQAPVIELTADVIKNNTTFLALCSRLGNAAEKDCQN
ncbi:hormogonium polysaccharide secretion pseudopilin HpsB [Anabaena sp. PCC 7108]|uniref:hormogonium polysaccharide secretion pseudopilin HpsB n=1 Tax=Anabaena sp. PCC 7108 TaxID=163908 RepID=UPI00034B4677|nr:hormogonium polysaccharide secretion pseudopilin HpsB [Anabaena sp. PCC 7108]